MISFLLTFICCFDICRNPGSCCSSSRCCINQFVNLISSSASSILLPPVSNSANAPVEACLNLVTNFSAGPSCVSGSSSSNNMLSISSNSSGSISPLPSSSASWIICLSCIPERSPGSGRDQIRAMCSWAPSTWNASAILPATYSFISSCLPFIITFDPGVHSACHLGKSLRHVSTASVRCLLGGNPSHLSEHRR